MLKTCHLLLAALLCLSSTVLQAATRKDTTAISFFKPATRESINPAYDFQVLMVGAISKIKHDSTAQGVDDLLAAMKVLSRSKQIDRVLSPSEIEMVGILQMMQSANADAKDRKLGYEFVKGAFGELDSVKVLQFEKILSKTTETPFSKRLRFYIDYFTPKKLTEGMALAYLRKNPKSFFATMIMAHHLYMTGRYAEGIEYCNRVIEDKPTYAIAYKLRGKCYVVMNLAVTALASYQQALQLFPTFVEANYDMGELLMDMDREEQAKDNFLKMYAIKPDYKWCTYHLARAYCAINQLDSALYYVNETIRNNPNDGFGYDMKGQIYTERNDYKTAINFYNQAITLEPQRGRFFEHRGDALANDHQFDKALLDFTFASLLDKTRIYPLLRLGDCYLMTKNYTQAIDYFEKAVALEPNDTYGLVGLNQAYTHFENYPEAIAHGLKAIATDSTYALAWGNLGRTYYCAGDFNKCIQYSNKAIALEKNSSYAMFNVALATLRKGEVAKATDLYRQFAKTCRDNDYPISSDAAKDLKELIAKHIYEKEAQQIVSEVFGEKAQG